jgi:hypothetical protein
MRGCARFTFVMDRLKDRKVNIPNRVKWHPPVLSNPFSLDDLYKQLDRLLE